MESAIRDSAVELWELSSEYLALAMRYSYMILWSCKKFQIQDNELSHLSLLLEQIGVSMEASFKVWSNDTIKHRDGKS